LSVPSSRFAPPPRTVGTIDKAFSLFQSKLLHGPIAALSEDSRSGGRNTHTLLEALRKLFRLPE
jgi:hypothetical protein